MNRFRLQQGLLLTVQPDRPISLTVDQLRRLSWEEHAAVWRDYVNALAHCLVCVDGLCTLQALGAYVDSLVQHALAPMYQGLHVQAAQICLHGLHHYTLLLMQTTL